MIPVGAHTHTHKEPPKITVVFGNLKTKSGSLSDSGQWLARDSLRVGSFLAPEERRRWKRETNRSVMDSNGP